MKHFIILFFILLFFVCMFSLSAQVVTEEVYKETPTRGLTLKIFSSENVKKGEKRPAMVFFFGGGWKSRFIDQFKVQACYFAKKGIVCFIADYRVQKTDSVSPYECVMDAKSAVRYIKIHANRLCIDSARIIVCGASAGGHIAAATAILPNYNDPKDDTSVSASPSALVLFNPVIDNGPEGYGYERIGENYTSFSPLHNIHKRTPPTIIFMGEKDATVAVKSIRLFKLKMEGNGCRCDLHIYSGQGHGFFNQKKYKDLTIDEVDVFLQSLGYINEITTINSDECN